MKLSDIVSATTTIVVISIMLNSLLLLAFARTIPEGLDIAGVLSVLVASLVVGYMFSLKIQEESRRKAVARIAVLSAVVFMFFAMALFANPLASPAIREHISAAFGTTGWTNDDWLAGVVMVMGLGVIVALVGIFVGVYAGSMLRKPEKAKNSH